MRKLVSYSTFVDTRFLRVCGSIRLEKMTSTGSGKTIRMRRLIADERRLIQEKKALEMMLKNVQSLRAKLKVEQIQIGSNLQEELGKHRVEIPVTSLPSSLSQNIEEEENEIVANKPTLNLNVNNFSHMFFSGDEEEDEEYDSNDEIGCAKEIINTLEENEIDFDNF